MTHGIAEAPAPAAEARRAPAGGGRPDAARSSPFAVIVAHGSPSEPPRQEAAVAELARAVGALAPELRVEGATLADPDSLRRALARAPEGARPRVYPLFMSDGWFVSTLLPKRLAAAGGEAAETLPPLGLDPELPAHAARRVVEAAQAAAIEPASAVLVIAAHGAPKDPRAGAAARAAAARIAALSGFAQTRVCFVDEPPFLAEGLRVDRPALCLPFFAAAASHVEQDLPEAVAEARFAGPVLEPVGLAPYAPGLIARRLTATG